MNDKLSHSSATSQPLSGAEYERFKAWWEAQDLGDRANFEREAVYRMTAWNGWLARSTRSEIREPTPLLNLSKARSMIESRMHAHMHAHGCYDDSTNSWEYQGGERTHRMAWEEGMQEALDIVDAILKEPK